MLRRAGLVGCLAAKAGIIGGSYGSKTGDASRLI